MYLLAAANKKNNKSYC